MIRKLALSVAALAVLAAAALALLANRPDAPDAEDSDLYVATVPIVPPEENFYSEVADLDASLKLSAGERGEVLRCAADRGCTGEALAELVDRNQDALGRFSYMRGRRFQQPEWTEPTKFGFDTPLPKLQGLASAGALGLLHARRLAGRGRPAEALEHLILIAAIGRALQADSSSLLAFMTGMNMRIDALSSARGLLEAQPTVSVEFRDQTLERLGADESREGLKKVLRLEYTMNANMISKLDPSQPDAGLPFGGGLAKALFKRNRTRRLVAEDFRDILKRVDAPCPPPPSTTRSGPWWASREVLHGNLVGAALHRLGAPSPDKLLARRCEQTAAEEGLRAALAVLRFSNEDQSTKPVDPVPLPAAAEPAAPAVPRKKRRR